MNFNLNRFHFIILGILFLIIGLFLQNQIIGIFICLILAAVVFYDEKLAIYFLIITIPIRPFLIVYNTGYKFIGDILILFLLIKIAFNYRKNIRQLFSFSFLEITFFSFILVGVISAFITGVSIPAIVMQVRAFVLFFLLVYIVKRMNIDRKDVYDFALITFFTALLLSIQGLVEKLSVRTLLLPEIWKNAELALTNKTRVYGLIGGPNELGLFLIIAFLISFYLLIKADGKFKSFLYFGMTLIFTVFLLTYSRGTVLAIAAFLIIYLIIYKKINYFKSFVIIFVSSALLFFAVVNITNYVEKNLVSEDHNKSKNKGEEKGENGLNRFSGAFSNENMELSNADGRVYYVKKSIEVFKDRPVIGYGFATFGGAATQTYSSPIYDKYDIKWNFYSDNQYIQILAETGLIGTVLIFITILILGKITWALRRGIPFSPLLIFFFVAAITSGVVYNILENDVFTLYYFIIIGFAHHYLDSKKVQEAAL